MSLSACSYKYPREFLCIGNGGNGQFLVSRRTKMPVKDRVDEVFHWMLEVILSVPSFIGGHRVVSGHLGVAGEAVEVVTLLSLEMVYIAERDRFRDRHSGWQSFPWFPTTLRCVGRVHPGLLLGHSLPLGWSCSTSSILSKWIKSILNSTALMVFLYDKYKL